MTQTLHSLLASTYALYTKTQNFHWNIDGSDFFELHELFESQYLNLASEIDAIAELIRIMGEKVPSGLALFANNTQISDADHNHTSREMIEILSNDYQTIMDIILKILAELPQDQVGIRHQLNSFFASHQKTLWMLNTWSKNK